MFCFFIEAQYLLRVFFVTGVAYIKLVINMILCIYYPLYIGLALYYLVWLAKGKIPFTECAVAKLSQVSLIVYYAFILNKLSSES